MLDDDLVTAGQEIVARQPPLGRRKGAGPAPFEASWRPLGCVGMPMPANDNASHSHVKGSLDRRPPAPGHHRRPTGLTLGIPLRLRRPPAPPLSIHPTPLSPRSPLPSPPSPSCMMCYVRSRSSGLTARGSMMVESFGSSRAGGPPAPKQPRLPIANRRVGGHRRREPIAPQAPPARRSSLLTGAHGVGDSVHASGVPENGCSKG